MWRLLNSTTNNSMADDTQTEAATPATPPAPTAIALDPTQSKTIKVSSLGYNTLTYAVPATVEEYDRLAKKTGATLDSAVLNVIYRGTLAEFRSKFIETVSNNTGIERATEPVLDKEGKQKVDEDKEPVVRFVNTEGKDFDLILATLVKNDKFESVEAAAASFTTLAQSILDGIPFDPSESDRKPAGPKKVAKAYVTIATKAEAAGKLDTLAAALATKLGNWTVVATVDSVARAIGEDQRRQREAKNVGAEYGVES